MQSTLIRPVDKANIIANIVAELYPNVDLVCEDLYLLNKVSNELKQFKISLLYKKTDESLYVFIDIYDSLREEYGDLGYSEFINLYLEKCRKHINEISLSGNLISYIKDTYSQFQSLEHYRSCVLNRINAPVDVLQKYEKHLSVVQCQRMSSKTSVIFADRKKSVLPMSAERMYFIFDDTETIPDWVPICTAQENALLDCQVLKTYQYSDIEVNNVPREISISAINKLIKNPYVFFLRYILDVKEKSFKGYAFRDLVLPIFQSYLQGKSQEIEGIYKKHFDEYSCATKILVKDKGLEVVRRFVALYLEREGVAEGIKNQCHVLLQKGCFSIYGQCDAVDFNTDETLTIVKYNFGSIPSYESIYYGECIVPILHVIAASEFFNKKVSALLLYCITPAGIEVKNIAGDVLTQSIERVSKILIDTLTVMNNGFIIRNREHIKAY